MTNFDLDDFLFGDISTEEPKPEVKREIETPKEEKPKEEEKEKVENIVEPKPLLSVASNISQSESLALEQEKTSVGPKFESREDIIKSINFTPKEAPLILKNDVLEEKIKVEEVKPIDLVDEKPLPEIVDVQPQYKNEPKINPVPVKTNKSTVKFVVYLVFTVLISALLIFIYFNRESFPIFKDEALVGKALNGNVVEPKQEISLADSIVIENNLDQAIYNLVTGNYKIMDTGGFALLYTDIENDAEIEKQVEITLDGLLSPTYMHEGEIMFMNTKDGHQIAWDKDGTKHIMSEDERYFVVTEESDLYYQNYLGQHILIDLMNGYFSNKEGILKVDENTWSWDWSFYTPINSYRTKNLLHTKIILDPETKYINEIKLMDGEREIGSYIFAFEVTGAVADDYSYVPSNYTRVDEANFIL